MFKWCSYCQRLIGEIEPFEALEFSHGICSRCIKNRRWSPAYRESVEKLAKFHNEIVEIGRIGDLSRAPEVLKKGLKLRVRPLDFLVGIIQPALYKIGSLWEAGDISIAEEHRFTAFCSRVVELCYQVSPHALRQSKQPDIILVNAPGNYHFLGLKIVELWLISKNRHVFTIFPGIPEDEIVKLASDMKPKYIGISVAASGQEGVVSELSYSLTKVPFFGRQRPILLVGGSAIRRGDWKMKKIENVIYCKEVSALDRIFAPEKPNRQLKKAA